MIIARHGASLALLVLSAIALLASTAASLGVVSFDYGADSLKTALIKPGMTPDVVLTRDSKRKLPAVVAWKMQDRSYGTDALNLATRYPGDSYPAAKLLLGRSFSDQAVASRYARLLAANLTATDRNTFAVTRATDYTLDNSGPDTHTAEELVGMQLSHAKMLAEETADEKLKVTYPGTIGTFGGLDAVVTVPAYWTASERQAIFDSATLAGFRPRIVSDAAAAATSFALSRNFPTPELHLLYDSGHSATRASLVRFSTKSFPTQDLFGTSLKEHTFIEVLSVGWSRDSGGLALDDILRQLLVQKFKENSKEDIEANPRAMAKLLLSASKAKHVLSANSDARVNIEGLINDVDFRTSVTREEFEAAVSKQKLDQAFSSVVADALKRGGNAKMSDLSSVILIGGTSRVPLVQKSLSTAGVPANLIAQNLNADEAIALGAGFYGASFNPQLKMKPMRVADVNAYPIVLRESDGKEELLWKGSPETFEEEVKARYYDGATEDFSFEIEYGPGAEKLLSDGEFERPLYRVEVEEINNTLAALKAAGELSKVETSVNVSIASRPLGAVVVESAWLTVKPKKGGVVGALRNFFGGSAAGDEADSAAAVDVDATGSEASADNATNVSSATNSSSTPVADALHPRHVRLSVKTIPLGSIKPMSGETQTKSKDKLYLADAAARRKLQTEEARNKLESYIYRVRELTSSDAPAGFVAASKPAEREKMAKLAGEIGEWLSAGGKSVERASAEELRGKLGSLEKLVQPVERRQAEARGRKSASSKMNRVLSDARDFLTQADANLTEAVASGTSSRFARTDLDALETQIKAEGDWFAKVEKEQEKKGQDEEPAWRVEEVEKRSKKLADKVGKLKKRRIPKTRPVASGKKGDNKTSSSGSSTASAADETPKHEEL